MKAVITATVWCKGTEVLAGNHSLTRTSGSVTPKTTQYGFALASMASSCFGWRCTQAMRLRKNQLSASYSHRHTKT